MTLAGTLPIMLQRFAQHNSGSVPNLQFPRPNIVTGSRNAAVIKRVKNAGLFVLSFAHTLARDYSRDHGSLIAAAVSFYAFMSLIPLILLSVSVIAFFLGSMEEAQASVMRVLSQYNPAVEQTAGETVRAVVRDVIGKRAALGGISVVVLAMTGSAAANSLCRAVNLAWDIKVRRGLLAQRLLDIAVVFGGVALLGASLAATAAIEVLRNLRLGVLGVTADRLPFLWQFLGYVVPLLMTFSAFALIYKVLPNVRVPLRVALVGALFAGVLWEVAKIGFAFYVGHFARTATVYGSLAGVILLQVWINVGAAITILGAEVASEWQKVSSGGCTAAPR